jgi:glycosyltransferase involved in cell wall biosynthesis
MMLTTFVYFPYLSAAPSSMRIFFDDVCAALEQAGHNVVAVSITGLAGARRTISLPPRLRTGIGRVDAAMLGVVTRRALRCMPREHMAIVDLSQEFILNARLDRSLVIFHDTIQLDRPRSRGIALLMRQAITRSRRAARVVAVSGATARDLERFGVTSTVIYNHFDVERFRTFSRPIDAPSYDVVWCGTPAPHKRLDLLCALATAEPTRRFAAVLPGAAPLGLPANLTILSGLGMDAYLSLLAGAGILISTSEQEGYGRPPMEALMLGTPVLVSDIAVYREVYGGIADFFALNPDALIAAYRALASRPRSASINWSALLARQGCPRDYVSLLGTM